MATAFGPQLIGETEKTLNALLRRHLADTGLTEPQWVTLRLADQLGDTVASEGLVDAVRDRAHFDDADDLVGALGGAGSSPTDTSPPRAASCSRMCRRRSRSTPRRSGPTFRPTTSRRRPGCSTRSSPAPGRRSRRSAILWWSKGSIPAHGRRHHGSRSPATVALAGGRDLWRIDPIRPKEPPDARELPRGPRRPRVPTSPNIEVPAWVWAAFVALLAALLSVDLVLHRGNHVPTGAAGAAGVDGLGGVRARLLGRGPRRVGRPGVRRVHERLRHREVAQHRQRLRVGDHLLDASRSRCRYQHRVLFWGIFGALALRAVFILGGSALHHPVLVDAPGVRRGPDRLGRQGRPSPRRRGRPRPRSRRRSSSAASSRYGRPSRGNASCCASTASSSRRRCSRRSS